jgi:hypothetical protein
VQCKLLAQPVRPDLEPACRSRSVLSPRQFDNSRTWDINFLAGGRMFRQYDPPASVLAPAAASVVVPKAGSGANYSFLSVLLSRVIVWVGVAASVHNRFMTMT